MFTSKLAQQFDEAEGEAFDAADWFRPDPDLHDAEMSAALDPEPEDGLSDIDTHYLTGEVIWEIEFASGYRSWYPEAEAKSILGVA